MIGRRIRLLARILAYAIGALVVVLAITLVVLRLTNPSPRDEAPRWMRVADMPQARGETASAVLGTRFVVVGGLYGVGRTSDDVHVLELARNEWFRAPSLPESRHHAAAAGLGEYVYVSGGARTATDWTATDTLWRAAPGEPWRARSPMPEGRHSHAMVALDGRLYVVGGVGPSDRTLVYDPEQDRWSEAAPIPQGRDHLRAVAWNGEVWAIGGRNGGPTARVDVYDPGTDRWRRGPDLPQPMSAMAVGVLQDTLYVVGGEDPRLFGGHVTDEHFSLARASRRWQAEPTPILSVHGAAYAAHSDRLYVAGGAARQGVLSTISWTELTAMFSPEGFVSRVASP